jgi:hypothetical protein
VALGQVQPPHRALDNLDTAIAGNPMTRIYHGRPPRLHPAARRAVIGCGDEPFPDR